MNSPTPQKQTRSDPDLPGPDLPEPRFTGRKNFPRFRKLTVYHPGIPGTPIYREKPFPPSIPVNRGPTVYIYIFYNSKKLKQTMQLIQCETRKIWICKSKANTKKRNQSGAYKLTNDQKSSFLKTNPLDSGWAIQAGAYWAPIRTRIRKLNCILPIQQSHGKPCKSDNWHGYLFVQKANTVGPRFTGLPGGKGFAR
eukprot:sb/3470874/